MYVDSKSSKVSRKRMWWHCLKLNSSCG